jgi:hypothetical protein
MNRLAKGKRNERIIADFLLHHGAKECYIAPVMKFRANNDIFGLWDMVLLVGSSLLMVQVKSHPSDFYKARKAIRKISPLYDYELILYQGKKKQIRFWNVKDGDRFKGCQQENCQP